MKSRSMRIRLAKKIESTLRSEGRYTEQQHDAANKRLDRTKSSREANACIARICKVLGKKGIAHLAKRSDPARALELLLEDEGVDKALGNAE